MVHYIILTLLPELMKTEFFRRFIDDMALLYLGTEEEFENLKTKITQKFRTFGLELEFRSLSSQDHSKSIEFLDVNHQIMNVEEYGFPFKTKHFIKSTATEKLYLNGKSYHSKSTYRSILYSEALRMRNLNEQYEDFITGLEEIRLKAEKSEFKRMDINSVLNIFS